MLVTIDQLGPGDEILIPCQVDFKRLKVERMPSKNKEGVWKNVKCAIRNDSVGTTHDWANYNCQEGEYNDHIYMELHHRRMWLIKKGKP